MTWTFFNKIIKRDLLLAWRQRSEIFTPLGFFILVLLLFPLALSNDSTLLKNVSPGMIWIAALLATLLNLDALFRSDFNDGSLEQFLLMPQSPLLFVLAKITAHWLVTGLPLLLLTPVVGLLFHWNFSQVLHCGLALLLGTPSLSLIGAIGIALTVGLRQGGLLLSLIILPLYIPILIFGATASIAALNQVSARPELLFLAALFVLSLTLAPFATMAALRVSVQ